jgi:hypothetical protein
MPDPTLLSKEHTARMVFSLLCFDTLDGGAR